MHTNFKLPDVSAALSQEERAWVRFLRDLHEGPVRAPSLPAI